MAETPDMPKEIADLQRIVLSQSTDPEELRHTAMKALNWSDVLPESAGAPAARSRTAEPSDMSDYAKFVFGGGSYTPVAGLGKYAGVHQLTVRAVLAEAKELYPRGADVIAALVWHRTLDYVQREHAITAAREAAVRECAEIARQSSPEFKQRHILYDISDAILSLLKTGETT